jgi:hypothetical protein
MVYLACKRSVTWNNSHTVAQFMKKIVYGWHIRKEYGIQHQGAHCHQDERLCGDGNVMPAKDVQLSANVCKLVER